MSRWRAALIHLGLSAVVITVIVVALLLAWYPPALFRIAGIDRLVIVLGIIDLVVGPLLTLIVFRAGKPGLKFDLTVIALLQLAFLGYGLHVLGKARPVFMVAAVDRFELVRASELDPADVAQAARPEFRRLGWTGPQLVGVRMPTDRKAHYDVIMSGFAGKDVQLLPRLFTDYAESAPGLLAKAKPLSLLRARSAADAAAIDRALGWLDRDEASLRFVPITAHKAAATMLLDARTGEPVMPLSLDPWVE